MPHDSAVDGTFIHILGPIPFVKALIPSFLCISLIVYTMSLYRTFFNSNPHSPFVPLGPHAASFDYTYFPGYKSSLFVSKSSLSLRHEGLRSWVYKRVFTTSKGLVTKPARPPDIPAHTKYQMWGLDLFQGYIKVLRFSLAVTTVIANGIFIITVMG